MKDYWGNWQERALAPEQTERIKSIDPKARLPHQIFLNRLYEVWVTLMPERGGFPKVIWLSIKRRDRRTIHDWRELQRIKNELVGTDCEAVELYPAEDRKVDTSNQFHLWVFPPDFRFPFGYEDRLVLGPNVNTGIPGESRAKQRAFGPTHEPPDTDG